MKNEIIEERVIAGEIQLIWDDLRSKAERQGYTEITAEVIDDELDLKWGGSLDIKTNEYKGFALVYFDETGNVTRAGYPGYTLPKTKYINEWIPIIEQPHKGKFVVKKITHHTISGARVEWKMKKEAETKHGFILNDLGKVYFGSMNKRNKEWYCPWGIKHDLVGDRLANAISDFGFLKV